MENSNIDIAEINRSLQENYIHYDPKRVDYTISNLEFDIFEQAGNSIWKDVFLATLGLGLPLLLNGLCDFSKLVDNSPITTEIFINILFACVSLSLSLICFIVWQRNKKSFKKLIEQIKNKPKYKLPASNMEK